MLVKRVMASRCDENRIHTESCRAAKNRADVREVRDALEHRDTMRVAQEFIETGKLGTHEDGKWATRDLIAGDLLHLRARDTQDGRSGIDCLDGVDQVNRRLEPSILDKERDRSSTRLHRALNHEA